jgi:hypothetical protein
MSDETRRVLDLLEQGKITAAEAEQLLTALGQADRADDAAPGPNDGQTAKRYFRINVRKSGRDGRKDQDVNIRVPISIVRGGMRLGTLIPGLSERMSAKLRERGVDLDLTKLDPASIESMLKDLGELNIDVHEGTEQVRITCE